MDDRKFDNNGNEIPEFPAATEEPPKRKRYNWNKIALCLIIAGAVFLGIGWLSGSRGGSIVFDGFRPRVHTAEAVTTQILQHIALADIGNIVINTYSARVIIAPTPQGEEHGIFLSNIDADARLDGHVLTIDSREYEREQSHRFQIEFFAIYGDTNREIRINLPPDAGHSSAQIDSTSGSVRIEGLDADSIRVESMSGSVQISDVRAAQVNANSMSGSVRAENSRFDHGFFRSVSGRIALDNVSWAALQAESTSGSVRISDGEIHEPPLGEFDFTVGTFLNSISGSVNAEIHGDRNDFHVEASSTSGTIRVNGETQPRGREVILSGERGAHRVTARTVSGSVRLYFTE